jgi:hypothetical protein
MKVLAFLLGCWGIVLAFSSVAREKDWTLLRGVLINGTVKQNLSTIFYSNFQIVLGGMILVIACGLFGWAIFSKEGQK